MKAGGERGWPRPSGLLAVWLALSAVACSGEEAEFPKAVADGVLQLAELAKDDFKECSGLVASRQFPGVLWTHNDGQDRRLFAIDRRGVKLAKFELNRVFLWDFEDLAIDDQHRLYLADIGNNLEARPHLTVHRVPEPDPNQANRTLIPETSWTLKFPGKGFDAEALFVWREYGYLISKSNKDKKGILYRWPLAGGRSIVLEEIGKLEVKSPITGADLSPDGRKLGLVATDGAYVIDVTGPIEAVIKPEAFHLKLKPGQIEGCAFAPDGLLAVAESRELFLFHAPPFIPAATD